MIKPGKIEHLILRLKVRIRRTGIKEDTPYGCTAGLNVLDVQ
jgi:hypothetical protein